MNNEIKKLLEKFLGRPKTKLFKLMSLAQYQEHLFITEAHIFSPKHGVLWKGDLNFTEKESILKRISTTHQVPLYIFSNLDKEAFPELSLAYLKIEHNRVLFSALLDAGYHRDESGQWKKKLNP